MKPVTAGHTAKALAVVVIVGCICMLALVRSVGGESQLPLAVVTDADQARVEKATKQAALMDATRESLEKVEAELKRCRAEVNDYCKIYNIVRSPELMTRRLDMLMRIDDLIMESELRSMEQRAVLDEAKASKGNEDSKAVNDAKAAYDTAVARTAFYKKKRDVLAAQISDAESYYIHYQEMNRKIEPLEALRNELFIKYTRISAGL